METLIDTRSSLRDLRLRTGMKPKELANKIAQFLGEPKERSPESVVMMEKRRGTSNAEVRDALEHIFGQYGIDASEVKAACRREL